MKNNLESSEISSSEWLSLNQFLHEIKQIDSSCVSIYYPYGKGQETISLLQETKRNESFEKIESKIESRIIELKKNKDILDDPNTLYGILYANTKHI